MGSAPQPQGADSARAPLVSAVIPTYNRAATIIATLESALAQTYRPLEVVVVDDGSTDETQDVLADFASSIVAIRQKNQGVAAARNAGISQSGGSILMFLDSDDLWLPNAVETQVRGLEAAGPSVPCVMSNLTLKSDDGTAVDMFSDRKLRSRHNTGLWTNVQEVLTTRFLFTNQTLAIRRNALETVGPFDESLWVMEDFELAMRLSTLGPWAFTTETVAIRQHGSPGSLTALASADALRLNSTMLAICDKLETADIPTSKLARRAVDYMARKATRGIKLSEPVSPTTRAFLRTQRFVEEEFLERVYARLWLFPRLESQPL